MEGPLQGPTLPGEKLKATLAGLGDHPDKLNLAGLLNVLDGEVLSVCCVALLHRPVVSP